MNSRLLPQPRDCVAAKLYEVADVRRGRAVASQNHTPGPTVSALDFDEDVLRKSFKVFQTTETRDQTILRYVSLLTAPY
ncbi:MAG: hypothetical protein JO025_08000 [Verrucomicrobia bacterium]|nr:hypothetical protein [Verrucomicrobiota bacterium]